MRRSPFAIVAMVAAAAASPSARAQVLHERVMVGDVRCDQGVCWREGRASDGATAIVADGEVVPAPSGGPQPARGEPIYTPADEPAAAPPGAPPAAAGAPPGDL